MVTTGDGRGFGCLGWGSGEGRRNGPVCKHSSHHRLGPCPWLVLVPCGRRGSWCITLATRERCCSLPYSKGPQLPLAPSKRGGGGGGRESLKIQADDRAAAAKNPRTRLLSPTCPSSSSLCSGQCLLSVLSKSCLAISHRHPGRCGLHFSCAPQQPWVWVEFSTFTKPISSGRLGVECGVTRKELASYGPKQMFI